MKKGILLMCIWLAMAASPLPLLAQDRAFVNQIKIDHEQRIALVIGNGQYASRPLKNAVNDAELMAATLKDLGFDVLKRTNLDQKGMKRAFIDFGSKLSSSSIALVFYAGHGMEVNKTNYMIPVDAAIEKEADVRVEGVAIDELFEQIQLSGSRKNILILDACRDNPFIPERSGASRTLGKLSPSFDIKIIYATTPGHTASDGTGANGTFTDAFVQQLKLPNQEMVDVLINTSETVKMVSQGQQRPYEEGTNFRFIFNKKETLPTSSFTDRDGDGIGDSQDKCPDDYGEARYDGCIDAKLMSNMDYEMGNNFYYGRNGVNIDKEKAIIWYKLAARNGNLLAQKKLGTVYHYGWGVTKDLLEAVKWHSEAANQGDKDAQFDLGGMYFDGDEIKQDYSKAFNFWEKAAKSGHLQAIENLGVMFENGQGVAKDLNKAFKYYYEVANKGGRACQKKVGDMFYYGTGVVLNYSEAFEWYIKAANQYHYEAQYQLAYMYFYGEGVEKNYEESFIWANKAADSGLSEAQYLVGVLYQNGYGCKKDYVHAIKWFEKAGGQGNMPALHNLGVNYFSGLGVGINYKEAIKWFEKAATLGFSESQYNLGYMYANGFGLKKDTQFAKIWYEKAAANGNLNAMQALKDIKK